MISKQQVIGSFSFDSDRFLICRPLVRIQSGSPGFLGFSLSVFTEKCLKLLKNAARRAEIRQSAILIAGLSLYPLPGHAEPNPAAMRWEPVQAWFQSQTFAEKNLPEKTFLKQLADINKSVNKLEFRRDQKDTWLTPREFFDRRGGDCEDFSIAKMYMLALNGVPLSSMEVWILSRNTIQSHAVLAVHRDKKTWILDNQVSVPYGTRDLYRVYKPRYAVSIDGWRRINGEH